MLPDALKPLLPSTPVDAFIQRALSGQAGAWDTGLTTAEVIQALHLHRIGPLVCAQAPPDAWTTWPAELQAWLKAVARGQVLLDVQQTLALQELLPLAHAQRVRVLLLKGVPVGYRYYPESHRRVKTDVDVLIRPADRVVFMTLLEKLGYTRLPGITGTFINRQTTFIRGDVTLDVHWSAANTAVFARALDFAGLWSNRVSIPALGDTAYGPSDEDLFLHACCHLAVHISYEFALIWLYDIHQMASQWPPERLGQCLRRAGQLRVLRVCLACLALAHAWFATPYPQDLCTTLLWQAAPEPSAHLLTGQLSRFRRLQLELAALNRRERLRLLYEMMFPPAEYLRWRYADATSWLPWLYIKRWLRWQAHPSISETGSRNRSGC